MSFEINDLAKNPPGPAPLTVTVFTAAVAELEEISPAVGDAHRSEVIIRLRDRDEVGSTFIRLLRRYARSLHEQGNLLMLEGLNERVLEQLRNTDAP